MAVRLSRGHTQNKRPAKLLNNYWSIQIRFVTCSAANYLRQKLRQSNRIEKICLLVKGYPKHLLTSAPDTRELRTKSTTVLLEKAILSEETVQRIVGLVHLANVTTDNVGRGLTGDATISTNVRNVDLDWGMILGGHDTASSRANKFRICW